MKSGKAGRTWFHLGGSLLFVAILTASAVAGEPFGLRLAAGPNWGGTVAPLPAPLQAVKAKPGVVPVPVKTVQPASEPWDALWLDVWQKTNQIYLIGVADTLKQAPGCTGNLGLEVIVEQTVRAVRDRKFGDAVRWMSQFQDRSLCLTYEGARGLDFALGYYTSRAIKELPADQQRIAVHGTFNLGILAFDQIGYTGKSWWQGIVRLNNPLMVGQMNAYPAQDLGLWSFNFENGLMEQSASKQALVDRLASLAKPLQGKQLGGGSGLAGGGGSGSGAPGGGSGGAGGLAGGGGTGAGAVGCVVAASGSSGGRGMFTCMQKATAGIRPSLSQILAGPIDPGASVRDPGCALSKDGGASGTGTAAPPPAKEPPPSDSDMLGKLTKEQMDQLAQDLAKETKKMTKALFGGGLRTASGDPGAGATGSGCGNASNAAKRAQAVYDCAQGGGSAAAGGASPKPGGVNPTISLTTDPQKSGAAAGMMACLTQGGSLIRIGANDPKCAAMRCVQGAPCPCEQGGAVSQAGVAGGGGSLPPKAGPDCFEPPCGGLPGIGGGVLPGGVLPGGVPPGGPRPTGPVSMPAMKGAIGTGSPLQQRGTIGTAPPLP